MSSKNDSSVDGPLQGQTALVDSGRPRMTSIAAAFVRCTRCFRDFRSPITFTTLFEFERAARTGMIAQCPNCYTIFSCNSSNMHCELASPDAPIVVPMPKREHPSSD